MHLVTMKLVKYGGVYPSIKYYKSFFNNFMFVSNLFKNSKFSEQNLMKMN